MSAATTGRELLEESSAVPHSIEAEQAVIGAVLMDESAYARVADLLSTDDFFTARHRVAWSAIKSAVGQGRIPDSVTVAEAVPLPWRQDCPATYLQGLALNCPTAANVHTYAQIVHDRRIRRDLMASAERMRELALQDQQRPAADVLHEAHSLLTALGEGGATTYRGPEIIVKCSPLDWAQLQARGDPPARQWAVYGWLGFFVNLLVGGGGIGKTLLAQQLGSALALGHEYIHSIERPLVVLAWFCEDEHDEIWRRQVPIADWLGVSIEDFREKFIIMPRHGLQNALVTTEFSRPMFTPLLGELSEQAGDFRADVVILDNAAQLYGGGENDRHAVTFFMNGVAGALPGRAVLLLAHPARSQGSEFAGSGAWENVARSRLFLGSRLPDEQPDADDPPDDNVRYLARRKANYTSRDYRRLTYREGVLVPDEVEMQSGVVDHLRSKQAERVLLAGLGRMTAMGKDPTDQANTDRYLPRLIVDHKLSESCTKASLTEAMRRLMVDGKIRRGVIGKYSNRGDKFGLVIVE